MRHARPSAPLIAACVFGACGAPGAEVVSAPAQDPCRLAADGAGPGTVPAPHLTLAIDAPVDPAHAPMPLTHAEAFVFRQLYETLVVVDCDGDARAGLARSWTSASDGRVWEFVLRDAAFWDSRPVTAQHVAAAWAATPHAVRIGVAPESVTVLDDRRLRVATDRPAAAPYLFAEPALAVAAPPPGGATWPLGSGPFQPARSASRDGPPSLDLVTRDADATITVRTISPTAARDALDGDADLLVTDDPAALAYASSRGDLVTIDLPWDRTYILLSPTTMGSAIAADSAAFRDALARDAVRTDARGAQAPYWWAHLPEACVTLRAVPSPVATVGRILYRRDDATARGLAARLVALSLPGPGLRAEPAGITEFHAALRGGADRYVLAIPRRVFDGCAAARGLAAIAPWLAADGRAATFAHALHPLVDVRRHVIARALPRDARVDWDGVLRFRAP